MIIVLGPNSSPNRPEIAGFQNFSSFCDYQLSRVKENGNILQKLVKTKIFSYWMIILLRHEIAWHRGKRYVVRVGKNP